MRLLTFSVVVVAAAACGCSDRNARKEAAASSTATAAASCQDDADCVGSWHPHQDGCGSHDRCIEARCQAPAAVTGVPNESTGRIVFETATGQKTYAVELARASFETTRGLMCRKSMKPDWGMLFFMPSSRPQRFWMKNTLIPLDLVFIDADWTVAGVVSGAQPRSLESRGVEEPSRYVLELNSGVANADGISAGAKCRYEPPGT